MFTKKDILFVGSCVPSIDNFVVNTLNNEELIQEKPADCSVGRILLFFCLFRACRYLFDASWTFSILLRISISIVAIFLCVAPITFQLRLFHSLTQLFSIACTFRVLSRLRPYVIPYRRYTALHVDSTPQITYICRNVILFNCTFSYRIWF